MGYVTLWCVTHHTFSDSMLSESFSMLCESDLRVKYFAGEQYLLSNCSHNVGLNIRYWYPMVPISKDETHLHCKWSNIV